MLKLKRIRWQALILLVLLFSITLGIIIGSANANIVPASYASETNESIKANQLKPAACTMDLVHIVIPSNGDKPTQENDLILGTSGDDKGKNQLKGLGGDDCIVGGGGNDTINGGNHINGDYCDGGSGTNTLTKCNP